MGAVTIVYQYPDMLPPGVCRVLGHAWPTRMGPALFVRSFPVGTTEACRSCGTTRTTTEGTVTAP